MSPPGGESLLHVSLSPYFLSPFVNVGESIDLLGLLGDPGGEDSIIGVKRVVGVYLSGQCLGTESIIISLTFLSFVVDSS